MARKLVRFTQGYSRYNKSDTAAFESDVAKKLCEGKGKVAVMVGDAADPDDGTVTMKIGNDTSAAQALIDDAKGDLETRARDLAERETALAGREADLAIRESALAATAEPADPGAIASGKKTGGEPPVQGAKA